MYRAQLVYKKVILGVIGKLPVEPVSMAGRREGMY